MPGTDVHANGSPVRIETPAEGGRLAETLLDPKREWPVVVISVHPDATGPYIDEAGLAKELADVAAVYLASATATFGLSDGLGDPKLSVFYGAGRVYPPGTAWTDDMYAAPLMFCRPGQGKRVAADLATAALNAAYRAGRFDRRRADPAEVPVRATVKGPLGPHHFQVDCEGRSAAMLVARLRVDVDPTRLLRKGQQLSGSFKAAGLLGEFFPHPVAEDAKVRARSAYPDGSVALAKISALTPGRASAKIHPEISVDLPAGADQDLTRLLTLDDVVMVRLRWVGSRPTATLADDAEESDLRGGLSVLPGGPAWLVPADLEIPEPAAPEPAGQRPDRPTTSTAVPAAADAARPAPSAPSPAGPARTATPRPTPTAEDVRALREQLRQAQDQIDGLSHTVDDLRLKLHAEMQRTRSLRKDLRRGQPRSASAAPVFCDPERQLRHEVYLGYLSRVPEAQRGDLRLPEDYVVGPGFLPSVDVLQGITRDKIIEVVVDVLTGRAKDLPGRQLHQWGSGKSGPQESRQDGGKAWRVSLQTNTPGARRMKYWSLPGGRIELDSVGHHDDGIT